MLPFFLFILFSFWGISPIFGVEIGRWEVVGTFETGISFSEISPVSDSELWIGGVEALPTSEELASRLEELGWDPVGLIGDEGILEKSLIYHFKNGEWTKETSVPDIRSIKDISVIGTDKGWAFGKDGILEFDGVFWKKAANFEYSLENTRHQISVINENEVWFASKHRYKDGNYENFSFPSKRDGVEITISNILMENSQKGIIISPNIYNRNHTIYLYNGIAWTPLTTAIIYNDKFSSTSFHPQNSFVLAHDKIIFSLVRYPSRESINSVDISERSPELQDSPLFSHIQDHIDAAGHFTILELGPDGLVWLRADRKGSYTGLKDDDPFLGWWNIETDSFNLSPTPTHLVSLKFTPNYAWALSADGKSVLRANILSPSIGIPSDLVRFDNVPFSKLPEVGSQTRREMVIWNKGDGVLHVDKISCDSEMFRYQPEIGDISSQDSLIITVVYLPTEQGQHSGKLTIESNDPDNSAISIGLSGATLGSIKPVIEIPLSTLTFDTTLITGISTKELLIKNTGNTSLEIEAIDFDLEVFKSNKEILTILPDESQTINFSFLPNKEGPQTSELTIKSNDPDNPSKIISVTGVGKLPPPPLPTEKSIKALVDPSTITKLTDVSVEISGDFPFSSAGIVEIDTRHEGSKIIIDLTSGWGLGDIVEQKNGWLVNVPLGEFNQGKYEVKVFINEEEYLTSSFEVLGNPATISDSVDVSFSPSIATEEDHLKVNISGDFPSANARISMSTVTVDGFEVSINLVSEWIDGEENEEVTTWTVSEEFPLLGAGDYDILIFFNGKTLSTKSISVLDFPPIVMDSVMVNISPSVPTTTDEILVRVSGLFSVSNGSVSEIKTSSENQELKIDVITEWLDDDLVEELLPWGIEASFSQQISGDYEVILLINGTKVQSIPLPISGPIPEGPISLDFNLSEGDQEKRETGNAISGKLYEVQVNVKEAPEVNGWSANIKYDPKHVQYVSGSFQPSEFISGLLVLVNEQEDIVGIGGTVLGSGVSNSGDGTLGTLSFEILEGFQDSTELVISRVTFRRIDGVDDKRTVNSTVTIKKETVAGDLSEDLDGNGIVDFDDFFIFADAFGTSNPQSDFNSDGIVDFDDFFIFADAFGTDARAKLMILAQQYLNLPITSQLNPNYPNPFNHSTIIPYQITEDSWVKVEIFDLTGQRIKTLVNDNHFRGNYEVTWDGMNSNGKVVSSGVYINKLETKSTEELRKMLFVK
ncbi:MAG: choice-of-anchor D domain-containing protein [Calditrichaeota bacterium]|jgi:hypothetical protein|nr:choice-of-anchor D domain-containing protein [Calditrichota bacterium]